MLHVTMADNMVYFPIQADSEVDVFKRLFAGIDVKLSVNMMVFIPHRGANVHGHR